jgi:hypothetical protein
MFITGPCKFGPEQTGVSSVSLRTADGRCHQFRNYLLERDETARPELWPVWILQVDEFWAVNERGGSGTLAPPPN